MTFFHVSDTHLGRRPIGGLGGFSDKRFDDYFISFEKIIDEIIISDAKAVIISGDFFDKKEITPDVLEKSEKLLTRFKENNIDVVMIEGNHDNFWNNENSWIIYLEKKGLIKRPYFFREADGSYSFSPVVIDDVYFYGVGYQGSLINEVITSLAEILDPSKKNVVLAHTAIAENSYLPGTIKKETIDLLKNKIIYAAGGHFHSFNKYPSEEPFFFIPGSPEYWDFFENDNKGFIEFNTDNREWKFRKSYKRNKVMCKMNYTGTSENDFKEVFEKFIMDIVVCENEDVLIIEIANPNGVYINTDWCSAAVENKKPLKTYISVKTFFNKIDNNSIAEMPIETLERELISRWEIFRNHQESVMNHFSTLKTSQRENNPELFKQTFDKMLCDVINGDADDN